MGDSRWERWLNTARKFSLFQKKQKIVIFFFKYEILSLKIVVI